MILFRAWDKLRNKIYTVLAIDFENLQAKLVDENNITSIAPFKDLVFNQSTELFDKNSKEIYEGDIVRWGFGAWIGYIKNFEGSFCIFQRYKNNEEFPNQLLYGYKGRVEVLGNIFEHSELIKK